MPFKRITYDRMQFKHTKTVVMDTVSQKSISYFNDRDRPASFSFQAEPDSISEKHFANGFLVSTDSGKHLYNIAQIQIEILKIIRFSASR